MRLDERSVCREGDGAVEGAEEEACAGCEVHAAIKKEPPLVGRDLAPLGFYEESQLVYAFMTSLPFLGFRL